METIHQERYHNSLYSEVCKDIKQKLKRLDIDELKSVLLCVEYELKMRGVDVKDGVKSKNEEKSPYGR